MVTLARQAARIKKIGLIQQKICFLQISLTAASLTTQTFCRFLAEKSANLQIFADRGPSRKADFCRFSLTTG